MLTPGFHQIRGSSAFSIPSDLSRNTNKKVGDGRVVISNPDGTEKVVAFPFPTTPRSKIERRYSYSSFEGLKTTATGSPDSAIEGKESLRKKIGGVYFARPNSDGTCKVEDLSFSKTPRSSIPRRNSFGDPKAPEKEYIRIEPTQQELKAVAERCVAEYNKLPSDIKKQYPGLFIQSWDSQGKLSSFSFASPCRIEKEIGKFSDVTFFPGQPGRVLISCKLTTDSGVFRAEIDSMSDILRRLKQQGFFHPGYPGGIRPVQARSLWIQSSRRPWSYVVPPGYYMRAHSTNGFSTPIGEKAAPVIAGQIWNQIERLTRVGYYHLDIKPQNICFTQEGTAVTIDIAGAADPFNRSGSREAREIKYSPEYLIAQFEDPIFDEKDSSSCVSALRTGIAYAFSVTMYQFSVAALEGKSISAIDFVNSLPYQRKKKNQTVYYSPSPGTATVFRKAGFSEAQIRVLAKTLEGSPSFSEMTKAFPGP